MSRTMAVTKQEVYEVFDDSQWHTKKEIAEVFGCSPKTISHRVTDLVKDGVSIINGSQGYRIITPSEVDEESARDIEKMMRWIVASVTRQAFSAKPMKKLMTKARALLPKSKEERMIVRKYLVQLTHLIDWNEAGEE